MPGKDFLERADNIDASVRELLGLLGPDLVFGTEAEVELVGDLAGPEVIVKLGHRGVRAGGTTYPARPTRPVDSTGAGDAFCISYLAARSKGYAPFAAARRATAVVASLLAGPH